MAFETTFINDGVTPGRTTALTLDLSETILAEVGLNSRRTGSEISYGAAEGIGDQAVNVKYWTSGAWTLKMIQDDITNIYEGMAGQESILPLSAFSTLQIGSNAASIPAVVTRNNSAQGTVPGSGYSSQVVPNGDPFLQKVWKAGISIDPSQVSSNLALSFNAPSPNLDNTTVPMDRTGLSNQSFAADQAFFFRFQGEGTSLDYPQYFLTIGFGQYAIAFTGDGKALLYEYCHDLGGNLRWVQRTKWRFASSKQVMGTSHTLSVFPHSGAFGEKFIAFGNNELETSQIINTGVKANSKTSGNHEFVYRADSALRNGDIDEAGPGHVTAEAALWWDTRRDTKVKVQASTFAFAQNGTLTDFAHSIGTAVANTNPVQISMAAVIPKGCTLTAVINDARTNQAFVPGTDSQPYPVFSFTGDGTNTPILYAYRLKQAEVTQTITPGTFPVDMESVSVAGYSGDPAQESAFCRTYDLADTHTRLHTRGRLSAAIDVNDPYVGPVRLFQGYVTNPRSKQVGPNIGAGFNAGGRARAFPAPGWRSHNLSLQGMYMRLAERVTPSFGSFLLDPNSGSNAPYKVTDAIRDLLLQCGFDSNQVDIPDLPYRLWQGHSLTVDDQVIQPAADFADCIMRLCRNYLGAYLWFNPNSGINGAWQLLFGNQPASDGTFQAVCNFVTTPPPGTMPTAPGSYPAFTTFIDGSPEFLTIPPNFNTVVVTTDSPLAGTNTRLKSVAYCYNYLSFNVPGATVQANLQHPDYIGYCLPYEIVDPSLTGANDAETWGAVAYTARRAYDFYCHAQRIVRFTAPLVFTLDTGLGRFRPVRFQDGIAIDGDPSFVIKSMNITYSKSAVMMCEYEAIAPMPGQYFMGTDGLHKKRFAYHRMTHKATGHATISNHWGLLSVSAAEEQKRLNLPLNNIYQVPLQDTTGAFYFMLGYDSLGSAPLQ